MPHWKLTLAYDGTAYHGWQIQPRLPTIQGTLAEAIRHVTGEAVLPQGSGRTDAGVHALAQVASVSLAVAIPAPNLLRALNRCLPPSIRVLAMEPAPPSFHARHSAVRKTYEYRIFPLRPYPVPNLHPTAADRICPPPLAPYVWAYRWPLCVDRLNAAAVHILGSHDFTSFSASDPDLAARSGDDPETAMKTPVRTIHESQWVLSDDLLVYRVTGSGFLHHMVRNLVGTFVEAGAARLSPDAIPTLLTARNRAAAGPTAPACGLYLHHVEYPDVEFFTNH